MPIPLLPFDEEVLEKCDFSKTASDCFDELKETLNICQDLKILREGNITEMALSFWGTVHGHSILYVDGKTSHILGKENSLSKVLNLIIEHNFRALMATQ